jgi:hypothetical protein
LSWLLNNQSRNTAAHHARLGAACGTKKCVPCEIVRFGPAEAVGTRDAELDRGAGFLGTDDVSIVGVRDGDLGE